MVWPREKADPIHAYLLARMRRPDFPEPIGVLRAVQSTTFDDLMREQITDAVAKRGKGDLQKMLSSGDTWRVA